MTFSSFILSHEPPKTKRKKQEGHCEGKRQQEQGKSWKKIGEREVKRQTALSEMKIGFGKYMGRSASQSTWKTRPTVNGSAEMDTPNKSDH